MDHDKDKDEDKKPRADSKLDSLKPESRVLELRDKLLANVAYRDILDWLALECGVSVSLSALTPFYRRHCVPELRERKRLSAMKAESITGDAGRTDWDAATMELVSQISFEIMSGEAIDFKTAEKFLKLVLKKDNQALARDKFEETKRQNEKAKDVVGNPALTAEEKDKRLKTIFRMG